MSINHRAFRASSGAHQSFLKKTLESAIVLNEKVDLKDEIRELSEQYKYRILTNSNVNDFIGDEPHNYILILTPERLISYLSQENNPPIGFVFVDDCNHDIDGLFSK